MRFEAKHREVFAADFRDRVVHHTLVPRIEKIFEPKFIHDSYAFFEQYLLLHGIFLVAGGHPAPLYEPAYKPAGLRTQYRWALRRYGGACIFFQVGCFYEFYGSQAQRFGPFFGLMPRFTRTRFTLDSGRRRNDGKSENPHVTGPTGTIQAHAGFPVRYLKGFKKKAHLAGLPYVVLGEDGYYPSGLKRRVVTEIFTVDPGCAGVPPAIMAARMGAPPARQ